MRPNSVFAKRPYHAKTSEKKKLTPRRNVAKRVNQVLFLSQADGGRPADRYFGT
jgi:hypothetical protein